MSKTNLGDKAGVVVVATVLDMAAESKQGLKHYKNLDDEGEIRKNDHIIAKRNECFEQLGVKSIYAYDCINIIREIL
ncbi:MAG: hypothetical protein Q4F77_03495 [Acinetobacter sp.]|uniref:hypothetical protein n=1 Tax=Acinetobacter sp. TaxID=472 RepID=UPI0026DF6507|nr:hypothetical protein [Acinetobacter sp.]MDO5542353.1 hypothetical protein [Acinetobacter sp.]